MFSTAHWATHGVPFAGRLYHAAWRWAGATAKDPCDCAGCSAP